MIVTSSKQPKLTKTHTFNCLDCSTEMHVVCDEKGFSMLEQQVTCDECKAKFSITVDEDQDCNYWFELEPE